MFKLIIGFMKFIIDFAAAALIISSVIWAFNYAGALGLDTFGQCMYAIGGGLVALVVAATFFGIPILLLQINDQLSELNSTVRKVRERIDHKPLKEKPHPLAAAFPPRPPRG